MEQSASMTLGSIGQSTMNDDLAIATGEMTYDDSGLSLQSQATKATGFSYHSRSPFQIPGTSQCIPSFNTILPKRSKSTNRKDDLDRHMETLGIRSELSQNNSVNLTGMDQFGETKSDILCGLANPDTNDKYVVDWVHCNRCGVCLEEFIESQDIRCAPRENDVKVLENFRISDCMQVHCLKFGVRFSLDN